MESKELMAQEIMIGNWLYYNNIMGAQTWVVVKSVGSNHINGDRLRMFDPIVITPEILEMAGWANYKSYYKYGTVKIWVTGDDEFTTVFSYDHAGVHIKYLHQLQQLYFALTGTHLKIELK